MPAQAWMTLLGAVVTFAAAMTALGIASATIRQKREADDRREWWTRLQWALSATYADSHEQRRDGWAIVLELSRSPLITATEVGIALHVAERTYNRDN